MLDPYQKPDLFGVNSFSIRQGVEQEFDLRYGAFAKLFETVFGTERTNHNLLIATDRLHFAYSPDFHSARMKINTKETYTSLLSTYHIL